MTAYDIIKKPIVTEASMAEIADKKYTFSVSPSANKVQIGRAVEEIFGVKVEKVTTMNYNGKKKRMGAARPGRTSAWKKAVVKLTEDSKAIELFEEMV